LGFGKRFLAEKSQRRQIALAPGMATLANLN
jgi:hypothetical protein